MPINWNTLYSGGASTLVPSEAKHLITLLIVTGSAHVRDWLRAPNPGRPAHDQLLCDKANDGSWMRIRVGEHPGNHQKAVIIYHKLQHFASAYNRWSISVGIHPAIFAQENNDDLAVNLNTQILYDVRNSLGPNAQLVIYDDVYPPPDGAATSGIRAEGDRRGKDIGDIGWIAEHTPAIWDSWVKIEPPTKVLRPTKNGVPIPGWGRDKADGYPTNDTHCIRTILEPV